MFVRRELEQGARALIFDPPKCRSHVLFKLELEVPDSGGGGGGGGGRGSRRSPPPPSSFVSSPKPCTRTQTILRFASGRARQLEVYATM